MDNFERDKELRRGVEPLPKDIDMVIEDGKAKIRSDVESVLSLEPPANSDTSMESAGHPEVPEANKPLDQTESSFIIERKEVKSQDNPFRRELER